MIHSCPLPYHHEDVELCGIKLHDPSHKGRRPGILMIHEFMGLGEYMLPHAERLARHGFVVLLADIYGKDVRPANKQEASAVSRIYRADRQLMRARANAGLTALTQIPEVNQNNLSCLGFSFGGCTALELARSGAPLRTTVSFYGYLNTPYPATSPLKGHVLVLHGAKDMVVPMDEVPIFEHEMRASKTDFNIKIYSDAGHGFANPQVETDDLRGTWYCEETAKNAWEEMIRCLTRT